MLKDMISEAIVLNKIKKYKKGIGGILFILTATICCFCMSVVISLGRMNMIEAVSDNIAYIVSEKLSIMNYNYGLDSYNLSGNVNIETPNGYYNPINDFNQMSESYGFIGQGDSKPCQEAKVTWDKQNNVTTLQLGIFRDNSGNDLRPHLQTSKVNNQIS
jgi:hypothetical protein